MKKQNVNDSGKKRRKSIRRKRRQRYFSLKLVDQSYISWKDSAL